MKKVTLGSSGMSVPSVIIGCMRIAELDKPALNHYIHSAIDAGANFFDHADIYNAGVCEEHFGDALRNGSSGEKRMLEMISACEIQLSREEWYRLYLSAGHILP